MSFEVPNLVAIVFAADESVYTFSDTRFAKQASSKKFRIPSASATPEPIAYSSASPELIAMAACVRGNGE